jgi:phosphotransferase system enzyme I (PtsI)
MLINGIGASPGISIGKAFVKKEQNIKIPTNLVEDTELEIQHFTKARENSKKDLELILNKTLNELGEDEAEIIYTHIDIIDDEEFYLGVENLIKTKKVNASFAISEISKEIIKSLEEIDDDYIRGRIIDIKDVSSRLIKKLLGITDSSINKLNDRYIIVSKDLKPSETAQMDTKNIQGLITELGSKTSHTAIFSKALGIPAIVGATDILKNIKSNDLIIFDGLEGTIYINPDENIMVEYMKKKTAFKNKIKNLEKLKEESALSKDNVKVNLYANVGTIIETESAVKNGCDGIGLFRTEFLYMNSSVLPTEEYQFTIYKEIVKKLNNKPVIIRTLDIGGDKEVECLKIPKEDNPFLGYRAIRICLNDIKIFKAQLRALLRASIYGNIQIMFPMISCVEELESAKEILNEVKIELDKEQIDYDQNIKIGIMIETPSAVFISDILAKMVDFFSIGTNDLIQYTVATDRMNPNVSHLYSHFHPSVLRAVKLVIDNAKKANIEVGMCGEAASDKYLIPLLMAMGIDEISMSPTSILNAKDIIKNSNIKNLKSKMDKILRFEKSKDLENFLINI